MALSVLEGEVLNFEYTGAVQTVELPPCRCKFEVWGAQGGYRSSSAYGGRGGYSVGEISFKSNATLYVQVGGSGNTGGTNGGYNGGGKRGSYAGGGGATDIRIGEDSLYARVIVAGGGGSDGATNKKGMYGGGTAGGTTTESYGSGGEGGTQTAGGAGSNQSATTAGTFGIGGDGLNASGGYAGAGGGGWYGGAGSYPDGSGDDDRGGGGGSGFVWVGLNAPSGYLLNESHYLTSASTVAGSTSFAGPNGTNETGHTGNGYARITVIELLGIPAPQNFKVSTKTENSISLSWDAVDGSIGYVLKKDGCVIANITTTEFTDTTAKPYRSYAYSVYAYNETRNSPLATLKASAAEPYGFETVDYRTASDVEEAKKLQNRIANGTATEEEISKWLDGVIGAYNAWDMNRVESAVDFIQKYLNGLQYVLDRYRAERAIMSDPFWKVPWDAYDLLTKKDWVLENIPSESDLARYLANVDAITEAIAISKNLPETMGHLDYVGANEIERALRAEYDACVAYETNMKNLIDNTKTAIIYSGEIYGGELDA